ncbi:MAG: TRAP transporter large permease [Rhodospirillaceae bacterium]
MTGIDVGLASIAVIVGLIYLGLYVPIALGLVSFAGVWILRGDIDMPVALLTLAIGDTVSNQVFATIPLFALMGLFVGQAGLGRDVYDVANYVFRRVRGGLGIATVAANAVFAAITGSSIASATVFTRISVPEMRRYGYTRKFAVGVVAGSSVLGMLIPPSAMLIIYAIVAEQSVGHMFIAGIVPGLLLAVAYGAMIVAVATWMPRFVTLPGSCGVAEDAAGDLSAAAAAAKLAPIAALVLVVLGGIYGGVVTPVEAGAEGSLVALAITALKGQASPRAIWRVLVETGHISAVILFLIIAASMYSRMLGVAALPTTFGEWLQGLDLGFTAVMALYVVMLIVLGTILDTASIILIVVPLFLPAIEAFGGDLVWFGIVTVVGAEIGLLTPPLGLSCFAIKSTIEDPEVTLYDIFAGAFPFAVTMLVVLVALIAYPALSLVLVY